MEGSDIAVRWLQATVGSIRRVTLCIALLTSLFACMPGLPVVEATLTQAPCPPGAEASPTAEAVVACVGSQAITILTFEHWRGVGTAYSSNSRSSEEHALITHVMGFLISAEWVRGEARDLHVHVSAARVRRQFEHVQKQQFPHIRAFRRFLRETKQTVADLLLRVELNLLSQRIQRQVVAHSRTIKSRQRAMARFVVHFRTKWKAQTYCAPRYAVPDCGHVQAIQ